jgi:hypothetical protein
VAEGWSGFGVDQVLVPVCAGGGFCKIACILCRMNLRTDVSGVGSRQARVTTRPLVVALTTLLGVHMVRASITAMPPVAGLSYNIGAATHEAVTFFADVYPAGPPDHPTTWAWTFSGCSG